MNLPEKFKIVDASAGPVTTNGGVTFDYVSVKDAVRAWIVLQFTQAVAHATVVTVKRATAVAGTGVAGLAATGVCNIWANEDTATSDTLVAQTAAIAYTLTADIKKKLVVIEVDPATLGDYDVIGCTVSDSSQATNFVSAMYVLETAYPQATPPAAITD